MEQDYFSIKLTIDTLGSNRFRSRLEAQSDEGSNFAEGDEFDLTPIVEHGQAPTIEDFNDWISNGTVPSRTRVEDFGKWLFQCVFRGEVIVKFGELKEAAKAQKSRLRICLALRSPDLINIPWEFMHDGTNFLQGHGYTMVRVLEQLAGTRSSFAPIRSVLLAGANPEGEFDKFDAGEHLAQIASLFTEAAGTAKSRIEAHVSADDLCRIISSSKFDAIYFVGHGENTAESGPQLICEKEDRSPDILDANRLAQALRSASCMRFVYLNSCSTGKTEGDNPFNGVAQRLMLDGNVAAVAAMQVDVRQEAGLQIAHEFFRTLRALGPEAAMDAARIVGNDGYSFGIPVLYSYLDAPGQLERNYLQAFLNADAGSKFALILPSFYLGLPAEDGQPKFPKGKKSNLFPGETFAVADTRSALHVASLLGIVAPPECIEFRLLRDDVPSGFTHYILFGSKSNSISTAVQKEFASKFEFSWSDNWVLNDKEYGRKYTIARPNKQSKREYSAVSDYGIVQRFVTKQRTYFIVAGLGSRATEGCGEYLRRNWRDHVFDDDLAIILRFPAKLDPGAVRLIDRKTGEAIEPKARSKA